jgi:2-dehydro-3-deoxyphosphogluconate aldolase/(4S)-4-hydroxy-2-oxoglutarate aldolase
MNAFNQKISEIGVVPVIKLNHPERDAADLGRALCAGGVPVAEITFRATGADIAIKLMKEANSDMIVGAGTVTRTEQIDAVIAAGGEFIVTPGFDPELVQYAQEKSIPIFPGCTTASEYHQALKYNLEVIKFFPAEQSGGLAKIKALSAPFPMFHVMPTGGISL